MNKMIIDTETANGLEQPLPYDIGYIIFDDKSGRVLCARSFVVAEIFLDNDLMNSAYYAEKKPQYWTEIKDGSRTMKKLINIRRTILDDMARWNVSEVGAYNMQFDQRAISNDTRYITASLIRWLFPYGTRFFCIWNMACTSICQTDEYIEFILDNEMLTEKGNIPTSAEAVYAFLEGNKDFAEAHTGLEDVRIEKAIYFAIKMSGMEFDDKPSAACWMKVKKYFKLWKERAEEGE